MKFEGTGASNSEAHSNFSPIKVAYNFADLLRHVSFSLQ